MYGSLRHDALFRDEVDKFIKATEKHAATLKENSDTIICPYKDCKNLIAFRDVSTIKEYLIRRGFVLDYTVWIHHGETVVVDDSDDDLADEAKTQAYLSRFIDDLEQQMDRDYGNQQGGGFGNEQGAGGASNDGEACDGDADDDDNLDEMLGAFGPEILEKSKRGLENLERVTKASKKTVYDADKGCPTYFTLLRFVLELLILKAKYGWSDYSFNDLLCLMSRLLPQPNTVPANTYQAKKVISLEKIHACPNHCILFRCGTSFKTLDTCPRCGASRYKNNYL